MILDTSAAMKSAAVKDESMQQPPPLRQDRSVWVVIATQFLGAFDDNIFEMLLLLICTDYVRLQSDGTASPSVDPYQTVASLLFALAIVLISGFTGFLSDRFHKKRSIVICKVAEIVVMTAGLLVFLTGSVGSFSLIVALFAVLFLMGLVSDGGTVGILWSAKVRYLPRIVFRPRSQPSSWKRRDSECRRRKSWW